MQGSTRTALALVAALTALVFPAASLAAGGDPDPSFGGTGGVTTGFGTTPFHAADRASATVKAGDGSFYVVGTTPAQNGDFAVVHYTQAGAVDASFGTNGIATADISGAGSEDAASSVTLAGGGIVVAGSTGSGETSDFAVVRFTTSGALDNTFGGGDGIVTADPSGGSEDRASGVTVLSSGNLIVAGTSDVDPSTDTQAYDFSAASFTGAGVLDTTFGSGDGFITTDFSSHDDEGSAVATTPSGTGFVIGGSTDPDGSGGDGGDFALARYVGSTGALDNGFDTDGKQTVNFAGTSFTNPDAAMALAYDSGGRLVAAGESPSSSNSDIAVVRLDSAGALDPGFNSTGKATINYPSISSSDRGNAVAIGPSDSVIVAGQTGTEAGSSATGAQWLIAKFTSAGAPDSAFDTDGLVVTDFKPGGPAGDSTDEATGVFLDGTKFVVTGTGNDNFAAARYDATSGALDTTFGTASSGKVETDIVSPVPSSEAARAVALQPDGKIVVVGPTNAGPTDQFRGDQDFAIARYTAGGVLDSSFGGGDGLVTTNFAGGTSPDNGTNDTPAAVAVQPDGKILVAGKTDPISSDAGDFAIARYDQDGTLDTTFNVSGPVPGLLTIDFGGGTAGGDFANAITTTGTPGNPSFRILVAGAKSGNLAAQEDFAVASVLENGTPDNGFDGDGKQTTDFGPGDVARAIAVQPDGSIVVGGGSGAFSATDFALARYLPTGAPDPSFGGGSGRVTTDFAAGGFDDGYSLAVKDLGGGQVQILLGGTTGSNVNARGALAAYTTDGSLDTAFAPGGADGDGKVSVDLHNGGNPTILRGLALQPDGKILASAAVDSANFGVVRLTPAGSLDPSWGGDGQTSTSFPNPSSSQYAAYGLAVQPDGKVVAAGGALTPFGGSDFLVARYLADPPPVQTPPSGNPPTSPQPGKKKCKKHKKHKKHRAAAAKKCKKRK